MSGLEALVLLRDDVVIQDRNFAARIRRVLRDPAVGVIGVVGATGLNDMWFWHGQTRVGRILHETRLVDFGTLRGDVDVVDGLLMVLSPAALKAVRFDESTFTGLHGYDADYCLSCRSAGLRVVVEPLVVYHKSAGDTSPHSDATAELQFKRKWARVLSRPPLRVRLPQLEATQSRLENLLSAFRPGLDESRHMVGAVLRRARRNAIRPVDSVVPKNQAASGPLPKCMLCGQPMVETASSLPLVRCASCRLGRTWPPPNLDNSSSKIFDLSYEGVRIRRRQQWLYEARHRLGWVETWTPEGVLLEVGCATGEFVSEAARAGYDAFGVEPSIWAASIARKMGANVTPGMLEDWILDYRGFTVDALAMFHVLEHLEKPIEVLEQCACILSNEGKLFIEVPNASSRAAESLDPSWRDWEFRFHHWHFTPTSLESLLKRAGLRVLDLRPITARPYLSRFQWEQSRIRDQAAGWRTSDLNYLRVVATPATLAETSGTT
jgi:2-polyprenyl-3-methyl-5-hydroxy-6-metoxy-1,4-benzoquinol methylase